MKKKIDSSKPMKIELYNKLSLLPDKSNKYPLVKLLLTIPT